MSSPSPTSGPLPDDLPPALAEHVTAWRVHGLDLWPWIDPHRGRRPEMPIDREVLAYRDDLRRADLGKKYVPPQQNSWVNSGSGRAPTPFPHFSPLPCVLFVLHRIPGLWYRSAAS